MPLTDTSSSEYQYALSIDPFYLCKIRVKYVCPFMFVAPSSNSSNKIITIIVQLHYDV